MIYYFKYDDGNAFTLNGLPYTGFFFVSGGKAYTGKAPSSTQYELSAKNTFMADFYLNSLEFDRGFDNIPELPYTTPNSFDILDISTLNTQLNVLDSNNLTVFKNLIIQNPNVFNINRTNTHFYGLSSTDADARNDDIPSAKNVYTHIDPFSFDSEWSFVDNIISGDFLIDRTDNFLYFCSDGVSQYTLKGNFSELDTLELLESNPTTVFYIKQDDYDQKIFMVSLDSIDIYDSTYFNLCQNLNFVDRITINVSSENKELIKIGKNIRTEFTNGVLYIKNKYSTDTIYTFSTSSLSSNTLLALDIRDSDDALIILSKNDTDYYISLVDGESFSIINTSVILDAVEPYNVVFSIQDSNLFYLITNDDVQLRMLSNITYPVGSTKNADYFYLNDYIYGTTDEQYGTIPIKYNSNSLKSNFFNNILFKIRLKNAYQYLLTHNIGRLYVSKLEIDNNLVAAIPLDLEKSYDGVFCTESSIGFHLNTLVLNLVKDTIKLYTMAKYSLGFEGSELKISAIDDLTFEINNLYIHGNETINVNSLQRMFYLITDIQRQLISSL